MVRDIFLVKVDPTLQAKLYNQIRNGRYLYFLFFLTLNWQPMIALYCCCLGSFFSRAILSWCGYLMNRNVLTSVRISTALKVTVIGSTLIEGAAALFLDLHSANATLS